MYSTSTSDFHCYTIRIYSTEVEQINCKTYRPFVPPKTGAPNSANYRRRKKCCHICRSDCGVQFATAQTLPAFYCLLRTTHRATNGKLSKKTGTPAKRRPSIVRSSVESEVVWEWSLSARAPPLYGRVIRLYMVMRCVQPSLSLAGKYTPTTYARQQAHKNAVRRRRTPVCLHLFVDHSRAQRETEDGGVTHCSTALWLWPVLPNENWERMPDLLARDTLNEIRLH